MQAWRLAKRDAEGALRHFLAAACVDGRPFVLAGHSQGSDVLTELIREVIEPDEDLRRRLVCAYLAGKKAGRDTFARLRPMTAASEVGGFVCWATVDARMDYSAGSDGLFLDGAHAGGPFGSGMLEHTRRPISVNPLTWTLDNEPAASDLCLGALSMDGDRLTARECGAWTTNTAEGASALRYGHEGVLRIGVTKAVRRYNFLASFPLRYLVPPDFRTDYHVADIHLFWRNVWENVAARVAAWEARELGAKAPAGADRGDSDEEREVERVAACLEEKHGRGAGR